MTDHEIKSQFFAALAAPITPEEVAAAMQALSEARKAREVTP